MGSSPARRYRRALQSQKRKIEPKVQVNADADPAWKIDVQTALKKLHKMKSEEYPPEEIRAAQARLDSLLKSKGLL